MAQQRNPKDLVTFKELLMANSIQVDTLTQLLIEEGLITEQKFFAKLKKVQAEYQRRQGNA
jgi:mannitol/fructose-specific phosphotransferase system IIA component (Ntr-type)